MSLILEALKKSEQQRRLGEAPTLGSPVIASRRQRSWLPLFGALIVIALGAGWWLSRSRTTPAPNEQTASSAAPAAKPVPTNSKPANNPAPAPGTNKPVSGAAARHDAQATKQAEAAKPAAVVADKIAAANANTSTHPTPATPNRPLATPATAPPLAKPDTPKPPTAAAAAAAERNPAAPATAPATAATADPKADPKLAAPAKPTEAAAPTAAPPPPNPAAAATAKAEPALPSIWELPYTTRKELPELALTMHVYASEPSQRFVVIKGSRHIEGDDLGDGIVLKEIRADGMVLDFKGQRFIYPRDGR